MAYSNKYGLTKKYKDLSLKERRDYNNRRKKLSRSNHIDELVNKIITIHDDLGGCVIDDILETLQDLGLLNKQGREVRHRTREIYYRKQ